MRIKTKITLMAASLVLVTALSLLGVTFYEKAALQNDVGEEIEALARGEAGKIVQDVYLMCRAMQESVQQVVDASLNVARDQMQRYGTVSFSEETVSWQAINQFTKQSQVLELPKMRVGSTWLGQNRSMTEETPLVDNVNKLVGGTVTVFQRMNKTGDMLRVATNVEKLDGKRAIGTYIPRRNPDGSLNPVIDTVLKGQTFRGRAYVVNAWYITAYEPIWDAAHKEVVGILYVGVKQENVASLRKGIMDIVVGQTGAVTIYGGKGRQQGSFILSKDSRQTGQSAWEEKDADGKQHVKAMVEKALASGGDIGKIAFESSRWASDSGELRRHEAAVGYFAPWDWVITAGYFMDDFAATQQRVEKDMDQMIHWILAIALIVSLLGCGAGYLVANGISQPLQKTIEVVGRIALGDTCSAKELSTPKEGQHPRDETEELGTIVGMLAQSLKERADLAQAIAGGDLTGEVELASQQDDLGLALQQMTIALREMIGQIQQSGEQISSGSTEVASSAQMLSDGATQQASAMEEISSSMTEMASQTKVNADNAEAASSLSVEAREAAQRGNQRMADMVQAMSEINEAGQNIAKIIKVIDEIAFQTNLLALNAAVEAARAGEQGKGFAVVAEEVRNLAARSSKAASETAELIEGSVEKAANGASIADQTAEALGEIVTGISKVTDLIGEIAAASTEQAQGIGQVTEGLGQIDQVTQQNTATSEESAAAAEQLSSLADEQRRMLSRFQLAAGHHKLLADDSGQPSAQFRLSA